MFKEQLLGHNNYRWYVTNFYLNNDNQECRKALELGLAKWCEEDSGMRNLVVHVCRNKGFGAHHAKLLYLALIGRGGVGVGDGAGDGEGETVFDPNNLRMKHTKDYLEQTTVEQVTQFLHNTLRQSDADSQQSAEYEDNSEYILYALKLLRHFLDERTTKVCQIQVQNVYNHANVVKAVNNFFVELVNIHENCTSKSWDPVNQDEILIVMSDIVKAALGHFHLKGLGKFVKVVVDKHIGLVLMQGVMDQDLAAKALHAPFANDVR